MTKVDKPQDALSQYQSVAISIVSVVSACMASVAMTALIGYTVLGVSKEKNKTRRLRDDA